MADVVMHSPDDSVFDAFTIVHTTFKTVSSHPITASILVPKSLPPGSHPLSVNLHGGFLITGGSTFAAFFPQWVLDTALSAGAIIVSGNYRLLPTPNGAKDFMEDMEDFWAWTKTSLAGVLAREFPGHEADLSRVMLDGGSAGGYGATQLALSHPREVRILATAYPMLDLDARFWHEGPAEGEPTVMHFPMEMLGTRESTERDIEAQVDVPVSYAGSERKPVAAAVVQWGLFGKVFDPKGTKDPEMLPVERVRRGARLPKKVWMIHGGHDTGVPAEGSHVFVGEVKKRLPETEVWFDIAEGQDHGFDATWPEWKTWSKEGLNWVMEAWVGA